VLVPQSVTHRTDYDRPCVQADAHLKLDAMPAAYLLCALRSDSQDIQSNPHSPYWIVLVS
jgi:hypothetical protein